MGDVVDITTRESSGPCGIKRRQANYDERCHHYANGVEIDREARRLYCSKCSAELDPYGWIDYYARNREMINRERSRDEHLGNLMRWFASSRGRIDLTEKGLLRLVVPDLRTGAVIVRGARADKEELLARCVVKLGWRSWGEALIVGLERLAERVKAAEAGTGSTA